MCSLEIPGLGFHTLTLIWPPGRSKVDYKCRVSFFLNNKRTWVQEPLCGPLKPFHTNAQVSWTKFTSFCAPNRRASWVECWSWPHWPKMLQAQSRHYVVCSPPCRLQLLCLSMCSTYGDDYNLTVTILLQQLIIFALGAPGIATRSKDATRGSWHRY